MKYTVIYMPKDTSNGLSGQCRTIPNVQASGPREAALVDPGNSPRVIVTTGLFTHFYDLKAAEIQAVAV